MKRDVAYYQRAWDESGQKFARAMRSIARTHYFTGEYRKAVECYEKALAINKLYADAWFTMGCAYMRLEEWKGAVFAFGTAISIDEN
jgi:tetratricopeptide (TPR) repeat protein